MFFFLALLTMSNLILPKKSGLWLPDHHLITPARAIVRPPVLNYYGAAAAAKAGKVRGKTPGGGGGEPQGVLFHSDWLTGTGTGNAAVLDTGKSLPWHLRTAAGLNVVTAASVGLSSAFPTTNLMQVTAPLAESGQAEGRMGQPWGTGMATPTPPFDRFYRCYYRHVKISITGGNNQHPTQDGNAQGDTNWTFNVNQIDNATYKVNYGVSGEGVFNNARYYSPVLQTGVTYRFEHHFQLLSTTQCRIHVRVFDYPAGDQILGDSDFINEGGTFTLATNPILGVHDYTKLDGLNFGCNGVNNLTQDELHSYQAAYAVSDTTWLGPYSGGI